ncbi:CaiB/BaiF CoA-transferase family protein [Pigmentiphaga soli]|uniref:CaiB/BaiF CoA-transferase family protein n=1 Tax=Pigmentiphaga soli TaxID=1007095 RepID=A0ABP8HGG5_9BURK
MNAQMKHPARAKDYGPLPLNGLRVLDFTIGGAGPFATKAMADYGAEVIKIESRTHPDFPRTMGPYAGGIKDPDRSGYFTNRNSGKLSLTLNLKKPEAIAIIKRLVPSCDVVTNNFRAGVLERLGVGYDTLSQLRHDLIYMAMPLQGSGGPQGTYSGVGHTLNVLSGLYGVTGYDDGVLVGPGTNYPDHSVNPGHGLVALMGALIHRRRTGLGQYIEVAQLESTMNLLGPSIVGYSMTRKNPRVMGNESEDFFPYGLFSCANDRWLAISIRQDEQWQALCRLAASEPFSRDASFAGNAGRLAGKARLKPMLMAWTRRHDAFELMKQLQENGVPAGVVQNARDLVEHDEQIAARENFVTVEHPVMGPVVYNGSPSRLSRTPARIACAPLLGEHTDYVLKNMLGMNDGEIAGLREAGVLE